MEPRTKGKGIVDVKNSKHMCPVCSRYFNRKTHLITHLWSHSREKLNKCKKCHSKFTQKGSLKRHMRWHLGIKEFTCPECKVQFTTKNAMQKHMGIIHLGVEKCFKCPVCKKSFNKMGNLRKHVELHTNITGFKCPICSRNLTSRDMLKRHMEDHISPKESSHTCSFCPRRFKTSQHLTDHLRKHGIGQTLTCSICKKEFIYLFFFFFLIVNKQKG